MCDMIKIKILENQGNQRLDRFLKKYFAKASLSHIYKLIRKDVKVNGKRNKPESVLYVGDEVTIYISEEDATALQKDIKRVFAKKQFTVIYEDDNILVVEKPFGLLTHGDSNEKKNHLANQVIDYLIANGDYDPRIDRTFVPSPANRLDRNTTGLVLFGKTSAALQELNFMLRERDMVEKVYMAIVSGKMQKTMYLKNNMIKDQHKNLVSTTADDQEGRTMETTAFPIEYSKGSKPYTLVEAQIRTGRTHQIRVQLAAAGYPIIGDVKYGNRSTNNLMKSKYELTTQLLHAYELRFADCREDGPLSYLKGQEFVCPLPERFQRIKEEIFG